MGASPPIFRLPVVIALAGLGCAIVPLDQALAQFFLSDPFPGEVRSFIHKAEFFGHAYGVLGIALTIYLLDESNRGRLVRLLSGALAAGIACDLVKTTIHRVRPVDFSFAPGESSFLGLSFLHVTSLGQVFDSAYHSFPSAHTATAVAFAIGLSQMYPQGRRWFLFLAVMVAVSRFDGGAHYVSDTLVGGILGYSAACWVWGDTRVAAWFARREAAPFAPHTWLPSLQPVRLVNQKPSQLPG